MMCPLNHTATEIQISLQDEHLKHATHCSPYLARLLNSDAQLLIETVQNLHQPYTLEAMQAYLQSLPMHDEFHLKRALRKLRRRVMARMIVRDLSGWADLHEVMYTTSILAECVIDTAISVLHPQLVAAYGQPVDMQGLPQSLIVIGMGKLGGRELNVSSDIDLIFAYASEGMTQGENPISNQEFFTRLAKMLITAIDEVTEDGFVFRVDMRLRPFGSEGVLVSNLEALEDYYQNNGREWERYAWIKGREITGGHQVSQLLKPFVFRKYLDYGAFSSMRDLKMQIQRDVNRRDLHDNIKLGRGGIREIEFIAQVFQLIRGGQDVSLQIIPTLSVLALLQDKGLLPEKTVLELSSAYVFLRNLEHRLMYVEDAQTQDLPKQVETQEKISLAMGFVDWSTFKGALNKHRATVQHHFDVTFSQAQSEASTLDPRHHLAQSIWEGTLVEAEAQIQLQHMGFLQAEATQQRMVLLQQSYRYKQLPELSRQRFNSLMPWVVCQSADQPQPDITLMRVLDFLEAICRRASYLALLSEYPKALGLVVKLCSRSAWCAQYLMQHPMVLDELLDESTLYAPPDFATLRLELMQMLAMHDGDTELQMNSVRQFKHGAIFRFAAQDIVGQLSLEVLSDYLSDLADLILDVSVQVIWQNFPIKHQAVPQFAVIGYGKLGGKELGYASDLDIIFLYDTPSEKVSGVPEVGEIYARFAQRINHWCNSLTAAGQLYETDLQLRPDGNSGLLVSSIQAFADYQMQRAWVWEHQALTRARFVAGDPAIGKVFEQIRLKVLSEVRDREKLRHEVVAMREKMRQSLSIATDMFDLKHSAGGIVDVEFIVQYLILAYAHQYPQLTENIGNIALLRLLGALRLIKSHEAEKVIEAYSTYRKVQHALKLQGAAKMCVEATTMSAHATAVTALWQQVLV